MVSGGFAAQFEQFMYYAGPIVQVLYWTVMAVAAVWAVLLLKRYVDHVTRGQEPEAPSTDEPGVDVEPFVE